MRRFPLAALLMVLAGPAFAQLPGGLGPFTPPAQVQPLPFTPYVPPVQFSGRVGRDYIDSVIPDRRVLAGASFFNTNFERVYQRLYGQVRAMPPVGEYPAPPPPPVIDPNAAVITLHVPESAEVFVQGQRLEQSGAAREIISPPLPGSRSFRYGILVRWHDGVKMVERQLTVPVNAGDRTVLMVMAPLIRS